jgi:CHAT domain-containing protein
VDADLVTLSACETGLGKDMGGEGLVGLTRAFQYAGARNVLASLWPVGDQSTAELMTRFYAHLREGTGKAQALRAAQLELIGASEVRDDSDGAGTLRGVGGRAGAGSRAHPFRWAAFELVGDGR